MEYGQKEGNFDAVIINDILDITIQEIEEKLKEWYDLVL